MQIFLRSTNTIAKVSIFGAIFFLAFFGWAFSTLLRSPYATRQGVVLNQPVPFSHQHHVAGLGIDCRYCHTSVEQSAFAGIPPTETCMNCHKQIWTNAELLEPVRSSYANNVPIEWNRVHDLPDFVYFNHGVHVAKGVGCVTCHGRVDRMPLTWRVAPLEMQWCLECHRAPERYLRPVEHVFDLDWQPAGETQLALGTRLVREYGIHKATLADCSTCHR